MFLAVIFESCPLLTPPQLMGFSINILAVPGTVGSWMWKEVFVDGS
jgi:hypothetical protein